MAAAPEGGVAVRETKWPPPGDRTRRWGYSGGLGPHNMERIIAMVQDYSDHRLWFDMETHVRTDDRFDLMKVEAVLKEIYGGDEAA